MRVEPLLPGDLSTIVRELDEFWGSDRTRHLHHPMFVHEFGDTAFVVRDGGSIAGYLMGFKAQTAPVGYIHLVGVRGPCRGTGLGRLLYGHFASVMEERGVTSLKAVTTPFNEGSIQFHRALGFATQVVTDYGGPGQDRVVMCRAVPTRRGPRSDGSGVWAIDAPRRLSDP